MRHLDRFPGTILVPSSRRIVFRRSGWPILAAMLLVPGRGQGEETVAVVGQLGGWCTAVAVENDRIYIGEAFNLTVLDVSTPSSPTRLGRIALPEIVEQIVVERDTVFVLDQAYDLQIVDVGNPSSPTLCSTYPSWQVYGLDVSNGLAILCTSSGFEVLDVGNRNFPARRAKYATGRLYDGRISGHLAYVAAGSSGLWVLDLADPSSPTIVSVHPDDASRVSLSGDKAYVLGTMELRVLDINDPSSLTSLARLSTRGRDVYATSDTVYVAWNEDLHRFEPPLFSKATLFTFDVTDPSQPRLSGSYDGLNWACDFAATRGLAYVADGDTGLQVIDVGSPSPPTLIGAHEIPGNVADILISGGMAYVANANGGLQIWDWSEPSSPTFCASVDTSGIAVSVHIADGRAYIGEALYGRFHIVDVTNPSSPSLLGSYGEDILDFGPVDIFAVGDVVYYVSPSSRLEVVDASDPASPTLSATYGAPGKRIVSVCVLESWAYLGWGSGSVGGLDVVNVSVPSSPVLRGTYIAPGIVSTVSVSGDLAYVTEANSDGKRRLSVIDVSDPSSPVIVGSSPLDLYRTHFVHATGHLAYVTSPFALWAGGYCTDLRVFDFADPSNPRLRGFCQFPGYGAAVCATDDFTYVAGGRYGLWTLRYTPMPPPAPSNLWANPVSWRQINLGWADNSQYEDGFQVERRKGPSGTWTEIPVSYTMSCSWLGPCSTTYHDTSASPAVTYYYRVRAYNTTGYSAYSNTASTMIPDGLPAAPSSLWVGYLGRYGPRGLRWIDNSDNEQGFEIQRRSEPDQVWRQLTTTSANVKAYAYEYTAREGTSFYRVRAYNPRGFSAFSNETSVTVPCPTAPSGLVISAMASDRIALRWSDHSMIEDGFSVERTGGGYVVWTEVGEVGVNVTYFQEVGLGWRPWRRYRVKAFRRDPDSGVLYYSRASNEVYVPNLPQPTAARPSWALYP